VATRPDVLIVLTDQQRPDSIGAYGQALPTSPTLDALAADGTVFDSAFTVQPVCGPARAAIQTGMLPTDVGCWRNGLALPDGVPTMASRLAGLGYRTGYVGKWHLASNRGPSLPADRTAARYERKPVPPERRGGYRDAWVAADALELTSGAYRGHLFDEDGDEVRIEGYRVDAVSAIAADRLERLCRDERPFLLFVSHLEPHHQNDRFRTIAPKGTARTFRGFDVPGDLRGTLGDWRWNFAASLACAAAIDSGLDRLLDVLRDHGRFDSTIKVFSSDHGSHFRTRNLEYKRSPHDASIRIPLVVHGPGFGGGRRSDRLVTHLDLLPTLLAAAGADPTGADTGGAGGPDVGAEGLRGRPLQEAVDGGGWRDEVLVQISESQIARALRTPTHTFSAAARGVDPLRGHRRPRADEYRATHLYDLVADPHQRRNLARDPSAASLRAELADRLANAVEAAEGRRPAIAAG